ALGMTQIRASIQQKLKFKKIDEEARKFKTTNIALPILTDINDDIEYNIPNVSEDELSDEENNDDKNAKWKLQDIFIENLGIPDYLANFINSN
ncbi:1731_t:CDS:2, partial [Funneliformis mosseae]